MTVKRLNRFLFSIGEQQVYWKTVTCTGNYLWVMGIWEINEKEFVHEELVSGELSLEEAEDIVAGKICERIILEEGGINRVNPDWGEGYILKVTFS